MRKLLFIFLFFTVVSIALAQKWTVQTVAFNDYRVAKATSEDLLSLGFDAYVDFAMYKGEQFARVRVGCFENQEIARHFAQILKGNITADAVVVLLDKEASPMTCINRTMGFITPEDWEYKSSKEDINFAINLAGFSAFIKHDGLNWSMAQNLGELDDLKYKSSSAQLEYSSRLFNEASHLGMNRILYAAISPAIFTSTGVLLWQKGSVAVVLEGDAVVAYHINTYVGE